MLVLKVADHIVPLPIQYGGNSNVYCLLGCYTHSEAQQITLSVPNGHNQTAAGTSELYSSDSDPDDPAYIDLLKREDVYPERARFDQLSREEANR